MLELTKKNIHMDCIKAKAGNQITIEDDVNIPDLRPDIDKVIFQSGIIRLEEVRPGNDQVGVKGSLAVHILYQSEEEEEPFKQSCRLMKFSIWMVSRHRTVSVSGMNWKIFLWV